jgi:hypothetical protein
MIRKLAIPMFAALLVLLPGCQATKKQMTNMGVTTPDLTKDLAKNLGVTEEQATGGVGALLQDAAEKISATDFSAVTKAVPGVDKYLKAAQNALGGAKITDLGGVKKAFEKLGMKPEMVEQFKPQVLDYVGKYSPPARSILATAL